MAAGSRPAAAEPVFEDLPAESVAAAPEVVPVVAAAAAGPVTVRHPEGGDSVLTAAEAAMFAGRIARGELVVVGSQGR